MYDEPDEEWVLLEDGPVGEPSQTGPPSIPRIVARNRRAGLTRFG